jgi:hypothetical protein
MMKPYGNIPVPPAKSPDLLWNVLPESPHPTVPAPKLYEPRSFLISKLGENDVVLLGANHGRNGSLGIACDILPLLSRVGVRSIGLEIATDQQPALDAFINDGTGLHEIDISPIIACPEYRTIPDCIRKARLQPVALDLPRSLWQSNRRRDEWMAENIAGFLRRHPGGKMLVIAGNLHTLKTVRWTDPQNRNLFIPGYLCRTEPNLRLCSILTEHAPSEDGENGSSAKRDLQRIPLAFNLNGLDVELRIQKLLAVCKMNAEEMADGLILY